MWDNKLTSWHLMSNDAFNLLIDQSTKRLQSSIDTTNAITRKSELLLAFSYAILTGCISYMISTSDRSLLYYAAVIVIFSAVSIVFTSKNEMKYGIYPIGSEPQKIVLEPFVSSYENESNQYKSIAMDVLESIQFKIDENSKINALRTQNLLNAKISLVLLPVCLFIFWALDLMIAY